jgi:hypothetical protein
MRLKIIAQICPTSSDEQPVKSEYEVARFYINMNFVFLVGVAAGSLVTRLLIKFW